MFHPVENPPAWLLDGLLNDDKRDSPCHDCGVDIGMAHKDGCDIAVCHNTGIQMLQCTCGDCPDDLWTGFWPGVLTAHKMGLVCYDTATKTVGFDLNAATIATQLQAQGHSDQKIRKALDEYRDT